tara:strand:- start:144 stop:1481 length:1338 start_codon:yes stop_codon:yes gene_type:complete
MAKAITNRVKKGKTPVIKKDLEGGVLGEANSDGTIFVDKSVKEGTPMHKEVVGHEMEHMKQMKSGELKYDDNTITYRGKKFTRENGKIVDPNTGEGHPEGSMNFPWEKEADRAGKEARNKGNKNNDDMNYNKNSGLNMNVASPITKKAKGYGSPLHKEGDPDEPTQRVIDKKDNIVKDYSNIMEDMPSTKQVSFIDPNNPIDNPAKQAASAKEFNDRMSAEITSGFASKKYGYLGKNIKEYIVKKRQKLYSKKKDVAVVEPVGKDVLKPVKTRKPGSPREQGDYEMGYYESRNKAAASRVQERESKRNTRQYKRSEAKFDRFEGNAPTDPTTGKPFTKRSYALSRTKMVDYANPVSKRKSGELAENSEAGYVYGGDKGTEGYSTYDKGVVSDPNFASTKGGMISSFLQNQKGSTTPEASSDFNAATSNPLFTQYQQSKLKKYSKK